MTAKIKINHRDQKTLDFLNDLYVKTIEPTAFSLTEFIKERHVNNRISKILLDKKILKLTKNGNKPIYTWNTIKPNINTARKLNIITTGLNKYYEKGRPPRMKVEEFNQVLEAKAVVEKVVAPVVTKKPQPKKNSFVVKEEKKALREFSFMWGLLRFKW